MSTRTTKEAEQKTFRRRAGEIIPAARSAAISEGIASGYGFSTHAAFLVHLRSEETLPPFAPSRFSTRMAALGIDVPPGVAADVAAAAPQSGTLSDVSSIVSLVMEAIRQEKYHADDDSRVWSIFTNVVKGHRIDGLPIVGDAPIEDVLDVEFRFDIPFTGPYTMTLRQAMVDTIDSEILNRFGFIYMMETKQKLSREQYKALSSDETLKAVAKAKYDAWVAPYTPRTIRSVCEDTPNQYGFYGVVPHRFWQRSTRSDATAPRLTTAAHGELTFRMSRTKVSCEYTGLFSFHRVACAVFDEQDTPVAVLGGTVFRRIADDSDSQDLRDCADAISEPMLEQVEMMLMGTSAKRLFANGPLVFLKRWQVLERHRGGDFGKTVLREYLSLLRQSFRGLGTVVTWNMPEQFRDAWEADTVRFVREDFKAATAKLRRHTARCRPQDALGPGGRHVAVDVTKIPQTD
jgi:hypothetical protein